MEQAVEKYLESVKIICPKVTSKELNFMRKGVSVSSLNTKDFYLESGAVQNKIGFVYKGLIRSFYINKDGKDISVRFMAENDYATNYPAFLARLPNKFIFQCLEPSVIVDLDFNLINEGYDRFAGLDRYGRLIAEEMIKLQQHRIEGFLFNNAEGRYLNFINCHPNVFNRISVSHLSTYLGIERPSLSRIRKKISSKPIL
jgi:CRP/FNR family transcriptional regulator, anaerobic regulatory protein